MTDDKSRGQPAPVLICHRSFRIRSFVSSRLRGKSCAQSRGIGSEHLVNVSLQQKGGLWSGERAHIFGNAEGHGFSIPRRDHELPPYSSDFRGSLEVVTVACGEILFGCGWAAL